MAVDENDLVDRQPLELIDDVAENGLAGHAEERLGLDVGVRTQSGAEPGDRDDDLESHQRPSWLRSKAWPSRRSAPSPLAGPISCIPTGSPSDSPQGTTNAGTPA